MPCLNIIRGVLQEVISIEELEKLLGTYLYETYGGQQSRLVTMDGKTMRGTIPKGCRQGIHLMAAYLPEEGIVLRQVVVDSKENEISAAPQLVEALDLKNRVICGDAMQTQRQLSVKILAKGGDYLWFLKENQATLLADAQRFFEPPQRCAGYALPKLSRSVAQSTNNGHGRLEKRHLTLMVDEQQFLDWPGVKQVFRLERRVKQVRTGIETTEVVYGITSCDPEVGTAKQMVKWTRAYWGIENGLHYRRDVTLHEDATRISKPNSNLARAIAAINNFIVALAQKLRYANLASARRVFNARIAAQLF
jgi:predicted transposase YbfD/YdcC